MIERPDELLQTFMKAESDQILVARPRLVPTCTERLRGSRNRGSQIGVAINPGTPVAAVEEVLPLLDIVMVMSVNPGFAGQSFIPESIGKIRRPAVYDRFRRLWRTGGG